MARIDLAKGFLYASLANEPNLPYNREQGHALLQQAISAFGDVLTWDSHYHLFATNKPAHQEMLTEFRRSVEFFSNQLEEWHKSATSRPAMATSMWTKPGVGNILK